MKWLFALLVLANVGLYMWGTWYHKPLTGDEPPPLPDVAPQKMRLLSEPGVRLRLRAQPSPLPVAPGAPGAASEARCYQLGPFATLDLARAAGTKLDAWGLPVTRHAEFETLGPAYRVYLPPLASKEAAERRRRELSKLGFADHALIQEAGLENAISLGIFAVEQNARTRVAQLARKGVQALVQPIPNVQPVYWLTLVDAAVDERIGPVPLTAFALEDWGSADVALRPIRCERETPSS